MGVQNWRFKVYKTAATDPILVGFPPFYYAFLAIALVLYRERRLLAEYQEDHLNSLTTLALFLLYFCLSNIQLGLSLSYAIDISSSTRLAHQSRFRPGTMVSSAHDSDG